MNLLDLEIICADHHPIGMDTFAECVGSQMLMMKAFEPLLKTAGIATEQHHHN
jgi:hypothetical protein